MCSGGFAKCLGISLLPLAIVCVLCNILLFFPDGKIVESEHISKQVWYFGGILGSGVLVSALIVCIYFVNILKNLFEILSISFKISKSWKLSQNINL